MVVFPGTAQKTVTADQYTIYLRYLLGWCRTAGWMRNTKAIQQGSIAFTISFFINKLFYINAVQRLVHNL